MPWRDCAAVCGRLTASLTERAASCLDSKSMSDFDMPPDVDGRMIPALFRSFLVLQIASFSRRL
jgi:hypothetical protein